MKIIVTHRSPDLDAICSVWLLKRFLQGWEDAEVEFVPAGSKKVGPTTPEKSDPAIELYNEVQVLHVDTGMGPLDHHQTQDDNVCGASRTFDYIKNHEHNSLTSNEIRQKALQKIVEFTINEDHFQEVHYSPEMSELYDFSVARLIDGYKVLHPQSDTDCLTFGMECLDITLQVLERRIWAEQEIAEKGKEFKTRWGKGLAIESFNDTVLEVAQKTGHAVAFRKDPTHGYIRIKALPRKRVQGIGSRGKKDTNLSEDVDLTPVYEEIIKKDPDATWYLHVSKKMLLNGSSKNPTMASSKLSIDDVIKILEKV